jgi:serine/threonine-protein kinase HipA
MPANTRRSSRSKKLIEPSLYVLVQLGQDLVTAGTLTLSDLAGQFLATFTYEKDYLDRAAEGLAFALDPINLPLRRLPFKSDSRYHLLGALFDAAPDAWGRAVMAADEGISPTALSESRVLLKGKGSGVGAILFSPTAPPTEMDQIHLTSHLPSIHDIDRLHESIRALEEGTHVNEELRAMLMSSWDIGGARPKVVVRDEHSMEWIVKFPRAIDTYSRQRVEWANLSMARDIGINTPQLALHELANGECALMVRRFDRIYDADQQDKIERKHYLSAVSLVSPPPNFDKYQLDTAYGASIFSYARIAHIIRSISANVTHDLQELYARMILNILVHNTDDHLKNTGFLLDSSAKGFKYRLSPLFDVVTQESVLKHMLHLGPGHDGDSGNGRIGTLANARAGVKQWGLRPDAAETIIDRVQAVVSRRARYYDEAGMSDEEVGLVEHWLSDEVLD